MYFWTPAPLPAEIPPEHQGWSSDEYEITGAEVTEVLAWAQRDSRHRGMFTLYAWIVLGGAPGLIHLAVMIPRLLAAADADGWSRLGHELGGSVRVDVMMATSAGHAGRSNEDFVGAVPAAAVLLDGAGIPGAESICHHGVAWYTHRLGGALLGLLLPGMPSDIYLFRFESLQLGQAKA